jgi:hypothetical protein
MYVNIKEVVNGESVKVRKKLNMKRVMFAGVVATTITITSVSGVSSLIKSAFAEEQIVQAKEVAEVKIQGVQKEIQIPEVEPVKASVEEIVVDENQGYIDYMVNNFSVPVDRAELLVNTIDEIDSHISKSLVLAMIQKETSFRNIPAADQTIEDSMGYVQMQSATRQWLRNIYPELPYFESQSAFQANPEAQILYMIRYLEYADNKFDSDFVWTVSSYNMGINNNNVNNDYVSKVTKYKQAIELYHQDVMVAMGQ